MSNPNTRRNPTPAAKNLAPEAPKPPVPDVTKPRREATILPCEIRKAETPVEIPGYGRAMVAVYSAVDKATGKEIAKNHDRSKCISAAKVHYGLIKPRIRGGAVLSLLRIRKSCEKISDTRVDSAMLVSTVDAMLNVLRDAGEDIEGIEKAENARIANVKAAKQVD